MSYQDCQPLFKYHEEELIALFIETLTGTTFEMTVSPYDTIKAIKNKIQRVEGIPVSQQHLLYNLHELEDSAVLMDYSITNGSTIKLVLSMRGGPISTVRRILPLDDITWKELIDFNRDDLLDDLPPGCRMAVLVFKEGDHLNMFKVLENIDGSYSPLSDSWSNASMCNLFEEDDSDDCEKQRLEENTVTMEKMNDLKNKLEKLAIQRKTHKLKDSNNSDCNQDNSRTPLPSDCKEAARMKNKVVSISKRKNAVQQLPPLGCDKSDESNSSPENNTEERLRKSRTAEFSRVPVLPDISPSPPSIAVFDTDVDSMVLPRPKTSPDHLTGHRICEILSAGGRHRLLEAHHCNTAPLHSIPPVPSQDNNFESDWCSKRHLSSAKPLDKPSTSTSLYRPNNLSDKNNISRTAVVSPFNIFQGRNDRGSSSSSSNSSSTISSLFSSTKLGKLPIHNISSKKNNITSHAPGIKSNKLTLASFQSMSRASSKMEPVAIKSKYLGIPSADNNKQTSSLPSDSSRNLKNVSLMHSQSEDCRRKISPNFIKVEERVTLSKPDCFSSVSRSSNSNLIKPISKKKKKECKSRCMKCNKRLTLTNTYTCRCGHIFCTNHRYSEAHDCTYDYKSEGRKILEQNNPLISAPKLPKI